MTRSSSSFWVAGILAVAVLGTFYTHQWYGPVGTLQHFFAAIRTGDQATLDRLAYPPGTPVGGGGPPAYANALKIEMVPFYRQGNLVFIRVAAYVPTPMGLQWWMAIWAVRRTQDGWKVDLGATDAANVRSSG